MNPTLFFAIFSAFGILYFILGVWASRTVTTSEDYFLASRSLGLWPITFTLIATELGGGMLLGTAEKAYWLGVYGITYTLGICIGFLLLGLGFAAKLRAFNVATTAELFEKYYGSIRLRQVASLLSVATMGGILIGQIIAAKSLLAAVGVHNEFIFIAFWCFVIAYTMAGGLRAVVLTDTIQVLIIIAVFVGIWFTSLFAEPASFFSLETFRQIQQQFDSSSIWSARLLPTLALPALFALIEQDLAQRFFAARSTAIAATSALLAGAFMLLFSLVPIYFGVKANMLGLTLPDGASPLIAVLQYLTNDLVFVFAVCGLIAAITSTADSLLCAISSNIAQDFNTRLPGVTNQLTLSKIVTLGAGIATLVASYLMPHGIIDILISSYELSISCLFVPVFACFFGTNLRRNAAFGAVTCGLIGFVLFRIYPVGIPHEFASLGFSLLGYLVGSIL